MLFRLTILSCAPSFCRSLISGTDRLRAEFNNKKNRRSAATAQMPQNPNARISTLLYKPLPSTGTQNEFTRLIACELDVGSAQLQCRLDPVSLADATSRGYYALSYVWGDAADTEIIRVNGHEFHATKNLVLALRQLVATQNYASRAIWVDAICINQADVSERSAQVKIMDQIYKNAAEVLCWLGDEDDSSAVAMRLITALSQDLHESPEMTSDTEPLGFTPLKDPFYLDNIRQLPQESILSLSLFSQRPYWTRIWTLQEMVLAGRCKLICGDRSCYLQHIEDLVDWVHRAPVKDIILAGEAPTGVPAEVWGFVTWIYRNSQISLPVMEVWGMRRTLVLRHHSPDQMTLNFLSFSRTRKATDIRDKLYGLSGICDIGVEIDYSIDPGVLFTRFAAQLFLKSSDIVYLLKNAGVSHASAIPDLPTWVPDWVHHGHTAQGLFEANTNSPPLARVVDVKDSQLRVSGVHLDTIQEVLAVYPITNHEDELQDVARITKFLFKHSARAILEDILPNPPSKYPYRSGVSMLQAILTLFLTDVDLRTRKRLSFSHPEPLPPIIRCLLSAVPSTAPMAKLWNGDNSPISDAASSLAWVLNSERTEVISAQEIIQDARTCYDDQVFADFMRYSPFSMTTRPFRASTGYIGSASAMVKPGDVVCVLGSCSMPVILRDVGGRYEFVSVGHVVGALYGEAWERNSDKGILDIQEFTLV
ncbi:heterokaryon incompatibility protein-domain-containing protein [Lasiosphaeris hirsuta]|uniref:Heterokaryon incompatibility protein-domain-containing protein n=1 Tax=Lasiosphaeris hirsuta TaxID=260670 RepID=A0AA39ZVH4_9PEZI|nr:heterokaryon incompatibility protein-domain-containing protein [Lasiosphaeris hirsuta]